MSDPNRPLKVFLCHAHSDKDTVKALYERLVSDGVDAWLDKEKLLPGQSWRNEIQKAVRGADVFIVCHSKEFNQAGFRQKEVKWALDTAMEKPEGEIFVIPARLEDCEVLDSLSEWHWVDLFADNGYEMLMRALRARSDSIGATLQAKRSWFPKVSTPIAKSGKKVEEVPAHEVKEEEPEQVKKQDAPVEHIAPKVTPKPKRQPFKLKTEYVVAIIGAAATIIAAIFGSPLIERMFAQAPEPAATATVQVQASLTEPLFPVASTETLQPTLTSTATFTAVPTAFSSGITDAKVVEMVLVPEGEFTMGSDDGSADEKPVHQVFLDTYYIDKYEVTNALYKACVDAGVCEEPSDTENYNNSQYAQHPVVYVNWNKANEYCEWRGARLPTEAEWEKAARGTDGRTYPWGEEIDSSFANYGGNVGDTTPVGSYESGVSSYGAYDMAGNAWEWVSSLYQGYPYSANDGREDLLDTSGSRVLRGGAWNSNANGVRSAARDSFDPSVTLNLIGFRCSRSLP